ncbi:hypothetical protein ACIQUM_27745 [Amycolatopsis azurea]|uniref:hypothetical protein n=1 Tax=Amycolatopsis azurea TaxID=36819 RepID=UPI0037F23405
MTGDLGRRAAFGMAATAGGALLAGGTAGAAESTADSAVNDKHQVSPRSPWWTSEGGSVSCSTAVSRR